MKMDFQFLLDLLYGVGIGDILLQGAFNDMFKHGDIGVTINAVNTKVALHHSKYGFAKNSRLHKPISILKVF